MITATAILKENRKCADLNGFVIITGGCKQLITKLTNAPRGNLQQRLL